MTHCARRSGRRRLAKLVARHDGRCAYCGIALRLNYGPFPVAPEDATRDHLSPRAAIGGGHHDNVVAACLACNTAKGNQLLLNFLWSRAGRRIGGP